jgi:outer membrane protein TolC
MRACLALAAALLLAGCATTAIDDNYMAVERFAQERTGVRPRWLRSDEERREVTLEVERLLVQPLTADAAVGIALAYSPVFQTMLAEAAERSAQATGAVHPPNPVLSFVHLFRSGGGQGELEIERALSVSLLDLILLPARLERAELRQRQTRLATSAKVVRLVAEVRQAWVRAVAARQMAAYYGDVREAAEAGAELARRMQSVGNFSRLQRAQHQAFYADAVANQVRALHGATAAREALVRLLGLPAGQVRKLQLLERLPDLPEAPRDEADVAKAALDERLDVQLARADLDGTARDLGLTRVTSVVNGLELGGVLNTETGKPSKRGYELELPLPLFDFGDASRAGAEARYLAAANRTAQVAVDADSQVREAYGSYRSAWDLARHYRDEIVPLRKSISDEMLLQYNGMLIGVFELLADARAQVGAVIRAIEAQGDFWVADAALQAALLGAPAGGVVLQARSEGAAAGGGGGH